MKTRLLCIGSVLALAAGSALAFAPLHQARNELEQIHNLLSQKSIGASGKVTEQILATISSAELHLKQSKNDKGSKIPVALKDIAVAREALGKHEDKRADEAIQDALKHVVEALRIHAARS